MILDEATLAHYGILRRSGRYPWGSGGNQATRNRSFLDIIGELRRQGLSDKQIAEGFSTPDHPFTTTQLRAARSIARAQQKQDQINQAQRLKDKGWSTSAIGRKMNLNESSVRALLAPGAKAKADVLESTSNVLRDAVGSRKYVDVGIGVERHMGISKEKLGAAVARLQEEGYTVHYVKVPQLGTGKQTTQKVLAGPDVTYGEVYRARDTIKGPVEYSTDHGRTFDKIHPPLSISSRRVQVKYKEDGGAEADGVIYVRRGVDDVSLGGASYAQVRIAVDGTHYMKGMAMYRDDMPPGVDLIYNTNKTSTGKKTDAMKPLSDDPDNPFGASISRQVTREVRGGGKKVTSSMNIVNEEGDWERWSRSLSSQFLSKQSPTLAKSQLDMTHDRRQHELDEIMALTNSAVRRKLLTTFADQTDAASVHLKAAALPRQATHAILPVRSLKETEVYAPNYKDGERVVLIRHPHGGIFEIPELTVNNRNPEAKRSIGQARAAIGINHKVAQRLSGADFDGDTVIVIPNNSGRIKTAPALEGLKHFDPMDYRVPEGSSIPRISARTKGIQMGLVSNLITDMTVQGASMGELARAVRHSMVVIDAEKHHLDYRRSAQENGIPALMQKYQGRSGGGAATLLSRSGTNATTRVPERRPRPMKRGGPVDRATGKKVFEETGATYKDPKTGKMVVKTTKVPKLGEVDDARSLVSKGGGTKIEAIYADHSNRLKAMADKARREAVNTRSGSYSPSAKKTYHAEVASLDAKLNLALRNAPLERRAQAIANAIVRAKKQAHPDLDAADLKKIEARALTHARQQTGAHKERIQITPSEWNAIQAGAITNHRLSQILDNADLAQVRHYATPRTPLLMTSAKTSRARAMLAQGYTQAEVADALGVSLTTLKTSL